MAPPISSTTRSQTTLDVEHPPMLQGPPPPSASNHVTGHDDHLGTSFLRDGIERLGPHQSYELVLKGGAHVEGYGAKAEGKLKISRRDDGQFEVEDFAALSAGAADSNAGVYGGAGSGARYVASTVEQAADLAQALATVHALNGAKLTGGALSVAADVLELAKGTRRDADARIASARKTEFSFELSASGDVKRKRDPQQGLDAGGKAAGSFASRVTVNLETGCAAFIKKATLKGEGAGHLDLSEGGALMKQFGDRFGGKVEVKGTFQVEERVTLPPGLKAQIERHELTPLQIAAAMAALPAQRVLVGELELEVKGNGLATGALRGKLVGELPLSEGLGPTVEATLFEKVAWSGEIEAGAGTEKEFDATVIDAEVSATAWTSKHLAPRTLAKTLEAAANAFSDHQAMTSTLDRSRLAASISG